MLYRFINERKKFVFLFVPSAIINWMFSYKGFIVVFLSTAFFFILAGLLSFVGVDSIGLGLFRLTSVECSCF